MKMENGDSGKWENGDSDSFLRSSKIDKKESLSPFSSKVFINENFA